MMVTQRVLLSVAAAGANRAGGSVALAVSSMGGRRRDGPGHATMHTPTHKKKNYTQVYTNFRMQKQAGDVQSGDLKAVSGKNECTP